MKKKKCTAIILAAILTISCTASAFAGDFSSQAEASPDAVFIDSTEISEGTVPETVLTADPDETDSQDSLSQTENAATEETVFADDSAAESVSPEVTEPDSVSTSDSADGSVSDASASDSTDVSLSDAPTETAAADTAQESIVDAEESTPATEDSLDLAASETESGSVSLENDEVFGSTASKTGSATITCAGKSTGLIRITAKVTKKIGSQDDYYYLFLVNPSTGALTTQVAQKTKPSGNNKKVTFDLSTSGHPEYIQGKYALAVRTKSGASASCFQSVSGSSYVKNPEKTATYKSAYELPATKKGLQTTEYSQITGTNSKAVFFNISISTVLARNNESVSYTYNGKTYSFNKIGGYTSLVSRCNEAGIPVTVQLLLDWTSLTKDLAYANSKSSTASYYAWDSLSSASRQKMEALFSFLSELFGSDSCYVSNWILGNEVNSSTLWNYAGNISQTKYVQLYSEAFRCLYNAVRGVRANSKCFICLDFYWNTTIQGYAGKSILNAFHAKLKQLQANVNWNLAYHAYPFPLTDCRFWLNKYPTQTTSSSTSPVITLNNLSVLTNYIKKNFGSKTRVILSEQGFTSSQGENAQAAALALGYYIAACNPMIDAFIIRSYEDQSNEVAQGLAMGIKGKKAFNVFKYMDSSKTLSYTSSYLKSQVGSSWKKKIPYYNVKRLYKLYRK